MSDPAYFPSDKLRITNDSGHARKTVVSFGGHVIPVKGVDIHIELDDLVRVTLVLSAHQIDVSALLEGTTVVLAPRRIPKR